MGYAVTAMAGRLIEAGPITPAVPSAASYERTVSLCEQVASLLETIRPVVILVEWTKGKVGKRHQGLGAGLAVYGCGVGSIATECRHWIKANPLASCELIAILENDWTRGVKKISRQHAIATEYSAYRISDDPDGDAADAIGLAQWWLKEKALLWS